LLIFPFLNSFQAENKFSREIIFSNKLWLLIPPPQNSDISVLHKICELYKKIYLFSQKIDKKSKFGIFAKIENACLDAIISIIEARFEIKIYKLKPLKLARAKVEILKRLIRISWELKIIEDKKYIDSESDLIEISKEVNNWINSLTQAGR